MELLSERKGERIEKTGRRVRQKRTLFYENKEKDYEKQINCNDSVIVHGNDHGSDDSNGRKC